MKWKGAARFQGNKAAPPPKRKSNGSMRPERGWLFEPRADSITTAPTVQRALEELAWLEAKAAGDTARRPSRKTDAKKNLRRRARKILSRRRLLLGP
jgi:hypothetical protein